MSIVPKIVINADDFGFSPNVNAAILHCAERGTITAASVMVNMPFAEEGLAALKERVPHLSLALHFTLTSGMPVSSPQEVPMLVDARGFFCFGFPRLAYILSTKQKSELLPQIQKELSAQLFLMESFTEKYSLHFDHLDSHQHIHALPSLWNLTQSEAVKRQIPLRVPRERWGTRRRWSRRFWSWKPQNLLKQAILNTCLKNVSQHIGYFGILESGRMNKSALSAIIQSLGKSSEFERYEINVHPSDLTVHHEKTLCCSQGDIAFHASFWRDREFQALRDGEIFTWAKRSRVELAGFGAERTEPPS